MFNFKTKYLPGNFYTNIIWSNVGSGFGSFIAYPIYKNVGLKYSFVTSFIIGIISTTLIINIDKGGQIFVVCLFV